MPKMKRIVKYKFYKDITAEEKEYIFYDWQINHTDMKVLAVVYSINPQNISRIISDKLKENGYGYKNIEK